MSMEVKMEPYQPITPREEKHVSFADDIPPGGRRTSRFEKESHPGVRGKLKQTVQEIAASAIDCVNSFSAR